MEIKKDNKLMSGKGEKGEWKTINGTHVFIEDGQSVEEAFNKHFSKDGGSKVSDDVRLNKILSERGQSEDADFAKDTDYFGYGSLDELEKAHTGGYKKDINQNKTRDDKYTTGNPDNINKSSYAIDIEKTLKDYKGSGSVDLVMPGGNWVQIKPQNDGSYLVRTSKGQKYVNSAEEAKQEVISTYKPKSQAQNLRNEKIKELIGYGYSKEQSEKSFDSVVDYYQQRHHCDRDTAITMVANDRG